MVLVQEPVICGAVSEPTHISWGPNNDLTDNITSDAPIMIFIARYRFFLQANLPVLISDFFYLSNKQEGMKGLKLHKTGLKLKN